MATTPMRVGGDRITAPETIEVVSPFDGRVLGAVPRAVPSHVDQAIAAARQTLSSPWPASERAAILDAASAALRQEATAERFARIIAEEAAKPIRTARGEVVRAVQTFAFAAAEARTLAGDVVPMDAHPAGEGRLAFTLRVPVGVIAAITPFNFPLNLVAHKLAPAIAAGCPVVLKPAMQTPLTALALADLLIDECGLDGSRLSVVTGAGADVGQHLAQHDGVGMVTFTGSPSVGWAIRAAVPRRKVSLELGNNSPLILEPGSRWRESVPAIAAAAFGYAGQSCISVQRVLAHASIVDEVSSALARAADELQVGDPLDEATDVSAMIDHANRDRVGAWIREAVDQGARLVAGGTVSDGLLRPTVLADVEPAMQVCRAEVFGPVLGVAAYRDLDEAIQVANTTEYGLHAGIFTDDLAVAMRAARELDFGGVIINDVPTWRADQMPYGGVRDSGNTREGPASAVREMTEVRTIVINA